jgi:hypothetical protein
MHSDSTEAPVGARNPCIRRGKSGKKHAREGTVFQRVSSRFNVRISWSMPAESRPANNVGRKVFQRC